MIEKLKKTIRYVTPMLLLASFCGLMLSIWSPFQTHYLTYSSRLLLWLSLCLSGAIGTACVDGLLAIWKQTPSMFQRILLQSVGATIPVSAILVYALPHSGAPFIITTIVLAWTISLSITGVGELLRAQRRPNERQIGSQPERMAPVLTKRLPVQLKEGQIMALKSEDHYVRVYTDIGSALLLMRLSDAIAETEPLDGLQTHRSWWVARSAVKSVIRKTRSAELVLDGAELTVPVSRTGLQKLKVETWV